MNKLKEWFWAKVYEFKYRKVNIDVCRCGSLTCDMDYSHGHVNAKDYYINRDVQAKLNKRVNSAS